MQEILGHSSIEPTLGTYSHVIQPIRREAADRLNVLFDEGAAHFSQRTPLRAGDVTLEIRLPQKRSKTILKSPTDTFRIATPERNYVTLLIATGLTFASICRAEP